MKVALGTHLTEILALKEEEMALVTQQVGDVRCWICIALGVVAKISMVWL